MDHKGLLAYLSLICSEMEDTRSLGADISRVPNLTLVCCSVGTIRIIEHFIILRVSVSCEVDVRDYILGMFFFCLRCNEVCKKGQAQ
jgi:hypothetical protein